MQIEKVRYRSLAITLLVIVTAGSMAACGSSEGAPDALASTVAAERPSGIVWTVRDTILPEVFEASGTAQPLQQAILSTRLMASVTSVHVHEGDEVEAGRILVQLDARDLRAREEQMTAGINSARAMYEEALAQATRIRALYADSAAAKAQLDAAEAGLTRAQASLNAARAAENELGTNASYATIRAPFAGIVTRRFVDIGAMAAPGAPIIGIQDESQLRIAATAAPHSVRNVRRGQRIVARIEGRAVEATVEGVVPAEGGNLYRVNALVTNPMIGTATREFLAGSAATLELPLGMRSTLVVPAVAITRQGDLTGVILRTSRGDELRWVRLGVVSGEMVEVTAGLRGGDEVVIPTTLGAAAVVTSGRS